MVVGSGPKEFLCWKRCSHQLHWLAAVSPAYRLQRVVSSTPSGEAQSFAVASSIAKWTLLVLAEALDGPFSLSEVDLVLQRREPVGVSDCRSLYMTTSIP